MTASIDDIAKQMLMLLPEDGTPVLNRVMPVMLSKALEAKVDQDQYFAARDILLKEGRVGVQRGQGGQVFLLPEATKKKPAPEIPGEPWAESQLMLPLKKYLEGSFRKGLDLPDDAACIVQDTSAMGDRLGRWARPDYIVVSAMNFRIVPGAQLDVHSFELKTEAGATDLAVYEALAQTRFTHFGHLVLHLPNGSKNETRLVDIEKQCDRHGIGLIRIRDPKDMDSFEILLDPERKDTLSAIVEGFLDRRLTDQQREKIRNVIRRSHS
ncbi:MAG: hypothetical protein BroJett024_22640 [Alphaproteobacteria bacterium]|nr:MAG: hypothetical protein BroJett024_22640 [Alphaproteobacteria bacterium]